MTESTTSPGSSKPPVLREDALAVLKRLRDAGHLAYFAGGCVRDELMGLEPKDYDVATDAPPPRVRELFTNTQAVGAAFGVILVRHRKSVVEVATFRTDVSYEDGRRPTEVRFTTAEEDARRRDFTINGLFLDPIENRVIDYVGGQEDIRGKLLRAIGDPDERFAEDHLRLLRAVRFAARFDLKIEPDTAAAMARHAERLARISPERIAEELRLMFTVASRRASAWSMLLDFSLIEVIFRFLPEKRGPSFDLTRSIFAAIDAAAMPPFGALLAAAALCFRWQSDGFGDLRRFLERSEVSKSVRAARQALRFSNDESDQMAATLLSLGTLLGDDAPTLAVRKRFAATPHAAATLAVMDAIASIGEHAQRSGSLRAELAALMQSDCAPPPLVTGDDLVARGMAPGPAFRYALEKAYDEQLEGRITTRDAAAALAEDLVRNFKAPAKRRPSSG